MIKFKKIFTTSVFFVLATTLLTPITSQAEQLVLNGKASIEYLNSPAIEISLLLSASSTSEDAALVQDQHKALVFNFTSDHMSPRVLRQKIAFSLSQNHTPSLMASYAPDFAAMFEEIGNDVMSGDKISVEREAHNNVKVYLNDVYVTSIESHGYFEFLATSLVGEKPISTQVKTELLAGLNIPQNTTGNSAIANTETEF